MVCTVQLVARTSHLPCPNEDPPKNDAKIKLDETLESRDVQIIGLYDPDDYDLDINMWSNSDGQQLKNIFSNLFYANNLRFKYISYTALHKITTKALLLFIG